jgi:hypothetical protein
MKFVLIGKEIRVMERRKAICCDKQYDVYCDKQYDV